MSSGPIRLTVSNATAQLERAVKGIEHQLADADAATVREVTDLAKGGGRRSIAGAGFSPKWQQALRSKIFVNNRERVGGTAGQVWLRSAYGGIFERGGDITGHPFLWKPIVDNLPKSKTAWTPSKFNDEIGKLSFVPAGAGHAPMLVGKVAVGKGGKIKAAPLRGSSQRAARSRTNFFVRSAAEQLPLFVGVRTVNIKKKFDVAGERNAAMKRYPEIFAQKLKST